MFYKMILKSVMKRIESAVQICGFEQMMDRSSGDLSIPEPGCRSYQKIGSARVPGVAARKNESSKLSHWSAITRKYGKVAVKIVPLIMETTGYLGKQFESWLKTIESVSVGPSRAKLLSQISVTLMKWNVECVREAGRKAFDAL